MSARIASAPGKIVLSGEYAVLDRAPAIAMAIDRRARVTVEPAAAGEHVLIPAGLHDGRWRFRAASGGRVEWLDAPPRADSFRLFERVWARIRPPQAPQLAITIDTRAFSAGGNGAKLGLGSSAAVSVALSAVLRQRDAQCCAVGEAAHAAHREYQGGAGSGVDVAVSLCGGVVEYRRALPQQPRKLDWPGDLGIAFLWSGSSADTRQQLAAFRDAAGPGFHRLQDRAAAVAAAWAAGRTQTLLGTLRAYAEALRAFDRSGGFGIFDGGHGTLYDAAAAEGVVYKPCGAGGGDIGAVFATDRDRLRGFLSRTRQYAFESLELALERSGLRRTDRPT